MTGTAKEACEHLRVRTLSSKLEDDKDYGVLRHRYVVCSDCGEEGEVTDVPRQWRRNVARQAEKITKRELRDQLRREARANRPPFLSVLEEIVGIKKRSPRKRILRKLGLAGPGTGTVSRRRYPR